MPAPSPVFFSQPQAPRCSRFTRIWIACCDEVVRFAALEIDDEADAAGIVLVPRVVQALLGGWDRVRHVSGSFLAACAAGRWRSGGWPLPDALAAPAAGAVADLAEQVDEMQGGAG